jgi:hypothetical protein
MILLNGPYEAGVHATCLLAAAWPASIDLDRLALMEHLILFGGDGVEAVQPPVTQASTGLAVRRANVRAGAQIFMRAELLSLDPEAGSYRATERAFGFVGLLECPGSERLKSSCRQAVEAVGGMSEEALADAYSRLIRADVESLNVRTEEGD